MALVIYVVPTFWRNVLPPNNIKDNTEDFVVASKKSGLELNADNPKYMVMYRDQNAGQGHSMKIDNICFKRRKS